MKTSEERFFSKVRKTGGCWLWTGAKTKSHANYYGKLGRKGKTLLAHRVSYEMHKGKIPDGAIVMHSCDNPLCVNPQHLIAGAYVDNSQDAVRKNRIAFGERSGTSKLTSEQAKYIAGMKGKISGYRLARDMKVTDEIVYKIWKGKIWRRAIDASST